MDEEEQLGEVGVLIACPPKKKDILEVIEEMQTQIASLHQKIADIEETQQAAFRAQMNRPIIDHSKDAIAGTR